MSPKVIKVLARATKADRRRARLGISLHELPQSTVARYNHAVVMFLHWWASDVFQVRSVFDLDSLLVRYLVYLWEDGETIGIAGDTLSGLEYHLKFLRSHLNGAWKIIGTWRKRELPNRAPPIPLSVVLAMCGCFLQLGHLGLACGVVLGFHCFLRTNELLSLRACDVVVSSSRGVVNLETTKKGQHDVVTIDDPTVVALCRMRLASLERFDSFVGCEPQRARTLFYAVLGCLGLHDAGFKWYSLRRGGATRFFQRSGSLERTLYRGRWESSRTARIYITEGVLALAEITLTAEQSERINEGLRLVRQVLVA